MKTHSPKSALTVQEPTDRCQFSFADGRFCRMAPWKDHGTLCVFHAKAEQQLIAAGRAGRELASLSGDLETVDDIHEALGKLFSLLAQNRIQRRDAVALAYICQLMLRTIPEAKPAETTFIWDIPGPPREKRLPSATAPLPETANTTR